jgi:hypothetical protein
MPQLHAQLFKRTTAASQRSGERAGATGTGRTAVPFGEAAVQASACSGCRGQWRQVSRDTVTRLNQRLQSRIGQGWKATRTLLGKAAWWTRSQTAACACLSCAGVQKLRVIALAECPADGFLRGNLPCHRGLVYLRLEVIALHICMRTTASMVNSTRAQSERFFVV